MGSLIIGPYDVLDLASPVILMGGGRGFGDPVPDTTTTARILLDGDVVTGDRASNRTVKLQLVLRPGLSVSDQATAQTNLFQTVNQAKWSMTWTPDGLPAVVFDCFRGSIERGWDTYMQSVYDTVTLTFPALPYTRDAAVVSLPPPAAPIVPQTVATFDSLTGLSTLPATSMDPGYSIFTAVSGTAYYFPDDAVNGDLIASVMSIDTTSMVAGTGSLILESFQDHVTSSHGTGHPWVSWAVSYSLPSTTDMSALSEVTWWAARMDDYTIGAGDGSDPTTYGVAAAWRDDDSLASSILSGTWSMTLVDTAGKTATWLLNGSIGAGWSQYIVDMTRAAAFQSSGFDQTSIAAVRLHLYLAVTYPGYGGTTIGSSELYDQASPSSAGTGLVNCTAPRGSVYNAGSLDVSGTGSGVVEAARAETVPVAAGQVYSGRCQIRAHTSTPRSTTDSSLFAGATFQCGIDWLNSSGTLLSTSWGAVTNPTTRSVYTGGYFSTGPSFTDTGLVLDIAIPTVPNVTAPTGATEARIRYRMTPASGNVGSFYADAPRITTGATAWRWPYRDSDFDEYRIRIDQLQTVAGTTGGVNVAQPYGTARFNIDGVARAPMSLQVDTPSAVTRLLLARTPDPAAGFNPFLLSTGGFSDAAALSGNYTSSPTWTVPAVAYGSTYAVLARVKGGSAGSPLTASFTAQITGDSSVIAACSTTGTTDGSAYQWLTVGAVTLPPRSVDPVNTAQTLTLAATGSNFDMLVLIDLAGEFVMVDGVNASRFWLDSPDSDQFTGTLYAGASDTRSDAISCAPFQTGHAVMHFQPGRNALTVVADQASSVQVGISYSPRWPGERPSS